MKKPSLKHIPLLLLCVYLIRSLILNSVSFQEVAICAILACLTAFYEMGLDSQKAADLKKQIIDLETRAKEQNDVIQEVRNTISAIKVSTGLRGLGGR